MNKYIILTLIPSCEASPSFLMGKIMQMVHLAIVDAKAKHNATFAVGFPGYRAGVRVRTMGRVIHVFGKDMKDIDLHGFLSNYVDYVHIGRPKSIPEKHAYGIYNRIHAKSDEQMASRYASRHGISHDAAMTFYKGKAITPEDLPYICLRSATNKTNHSLFVKFNKIRKDEFKEGAVSSYGLGCCVPVL